MKTPSSIFIVVLLLIPISVFAYTGMPDGTIEPDAHNLDYELELLQLFNAFRVGEGLSPLKLNTAMTFAGRYHCIDMIEDDYYSYDTHDAGDVFICSWFTRVRAYYPDADGLGHFIASWFGTPQTVFDAFVNDPTHLDIMKLDYREIGTAYAMIGGERKWSVVFAKNNDNYPLIIDNDVVQTDELSVDLYLYGAGTFTEMRLRNDGKDWSEWQPFQTSIAWTLRPLHGTRTVFAEMRNALITSTANDQIDLFGASAVRTPPEPVFEFTAFPNPFNPSTTFRITPPQPGSATLEIYDVSGRYIATLLDTHLDVQEIHVTWTGLDAEGVAVASGTYFARLAGEWGTRTRKVTLMK